MTFVIIDGKDGCGKTICLNQVVHWCWKAGWLVVHVPGGEWKTCTVQWPRAYNILSFFSHSPFHAFSFLPTTTFPSSPLPLFSPLLHSPHPPFFFAVSFWAHSRKELRPSQRYPGTYDQPLEASMWLKNFRSVNAKILKKVFTIYFPVCVLFIYLVRPLIPKVRHFPPCFFFCHTQIKLSESRAWTKRERSEAGEDLGKVIDQGLHKPILATDVVGVVLEELVREQARSVQLGQPWLRRLCIY